MMSTSLFFSVRQSTKTTRLSTPRRELGLDNLEKLRAKPGIRIGGQTVGHVSYVAGRILAYFLDLRNRSSSSVTPPPKWT